MAFPPSVVEEALVRCNRSCALCHKFCGHKMEVHHIVPEGEGGPDDADNAIPLCFDCHAEVRAYDPRHPKGRRFTISELKQHRDRWFDRCETQPSEHPGLREEQRQADAMLLNEIVGFVSTEYMQAFFHVVENQDWVRHRDLERLDDYLRFCSRADKEFLSPELTPIHAAFNESLSRFLSFLAQHTFVGERNHSDKNFLCPNLKLSGEPQDEIRWHELNQEWAQLCDKVKQDYDSFIRTAKRFLPLVS